MRYFLVFLLAVIAPMAQAEPKAEFKRTLFPVGKYLVLNGTVYLTKGAENVSRPGQLGLLTGRRGLSGGLIQNGFANVTTLPNVTSSNGWIFEIDGKDLAKVSVGGTVSSGDAIDTLDLVADGKIGRDLERNAAYKGVLLYAADWVEIDGHIKRLWESNTATNYLINKDFRVVGSVLYATGYTGAGQLKVDGTASLNGNGGGTVGAVNVTTTANSDKTYSIRLADESVIAFSARHLCWRDGQFAGTAPDVIGEKRPKSCPAYDD